MSGFALKRLILIRNEADVQRIVWTILRPTFPDLVDEDYLPKFGAKNYKPDFGIPSLRLLIEAKYVSGSKTIGEIQDELQTDIVGYRESTSEYDALLFFIYDTRGEVAGHTELHRVIKEQPGVAASALARNYPVLLAKSYPHCTRMVQFARVQNRLRRTAEHSLGQVLPLLAVARSDHARRLRLETQVVTSPSGRMMETQPARVARMISLDPPLPAGKPCSWCRQL